MNSLNSSLVDAGAGIVIVKVEREKEAETGAFGEVWTGAGTLATGVALRLIDRGAILFGLEAAEILEQEDIWEPLADFIGLVAETLLAIL